LVKSAQVKFVTVSVDGRFSSVASQTYTVTQCIGVAYGHYCILYALT
jgi:hypothetical protein